MKSSEKLRGKGRPSHLAYHTQPPATPDEHDELRLRLVEPELLPQPPGQLLRPRLRLPASHHRITSLASRKLITSPIGLSKMSVRSTAVNENCNPSVTPARAVSRPVT